MSLINDALNRAEADKNRNPSTATPVPLISAAAATSPTPSAEPTAPVAPTVVTLASKSTPDAAAPFAPPATSTPAARRPQSRLIILVLIGAVAIGGAWYFMHRHFGIPAKANAYGLKPSQLSSPLVPHSNVAATKPAVIGHGPAANMATTRDSQTALASTYGKTPTTGPAYELARTIKGWFATAEAFCMPLHQEHRRHGARLVQTPFADEQTGRTRRPLQNRRQALPKSQATAARRMQPNHRRSRPARRANPPPPPPST